MAFHKLHLSILFTPVRDSIIIEGQTMYTNTLTCIIFIECYNYLDIISIEEKSKIQFIIRSITSV